MPPDLPHDLQRSPGLQTVLFAVYLTMLNDDVFAKMFRLDSPMKRRQKNVDRTKDLIRSILQDLLYLNLIRNDYDINEALLVLDASGYISNCNGVISFLHTSDLGTELGRHLNLDDDILNKIADEI